MFPSGIRTMLSLMIEIELETQEPPEGWVRDRSEEIRFCGWVGLVQAVTEIVRSAGVTRGEGGEL